ncbi:aminotransferase class I/II-fold pyridoxal phosphate-dependent enzyme [Paenibacillus hexagrammi]|uniref:Aminotransferase class I/II-fold pyridoxal phosphate-dependent enzyme n=1 Tax=Paenibacillus hexagrammi TaxID=2908839 RepID=A0ABY3SGH9_9BACL|nr:aminotransferase class I/II-fold pyridoxal phosphate-dependent enzyme [Paenibacillus sp. YPD9-1]UJF33143.1 aminotransferase class I/II-fold pyridoxal phosphate-dependent enzyme [Paenibacillus sp. YPD9-1]
MTTISKQDRDRAPLYDAMADHQRGRHANFHVPGHKSGRGLLREASGLFSSIMSIDYTEISGLDDLHQAEGVILEAERLAADCFGAEETYFLVGGSTVGNLAMISALCAPGDILLVQRNVHKSVLNGFMLAGAKAVFLPPSWDPHLGVPTGININSVKEAIKRYPEAKGLFLTNPNYYGMGLDLEPITDFMHAQGKPVLVDEAHGAHYGFHEDLPKSAISMGADIVVQSTHKMLTAMTMGAMLHIQGKLINREAVKQRLTMLQSSSPSYPIMASLDLARKLMHTQGEEWVRKGLQVVNYLRKLLDQKAEFEYSFNSYPLVSGPGYTTVDPFKITIRERTGTLSGPQLRDALESRGCYVEMADARNVLLVLTPASTEDDVTRLYEALCNICLEELVEKKELQPPITNIYNLPSLTHISQPVKFDMRNLQNEGISYSLATSSVDVQQAIGKCSAEMVIPYPPGVPLLYPGERITEAAAEMLEQFRALGIKFQGTAYGQTRKLKIYT